MAPQDAATGEVEAARAGGVDNHLLWARGALNDLLAVIDEYVNSGVILKDEVGCLGGIQGEVRRVNDVHICPQPVGRQFPVVQVLLCELMERAVIQQFDEPLILLLENGLAFLDDVVIPLGVLDLCQEHLCQGKGLVILALDGLVGDDVENLANAAVLVRRIVPAVDAVDVFEPGRHRLPRIESLPGLVGRAA